MKNDKITGRTIEFNGRTFTSPAVYPRFAFWCDEITGKIAIANVDENTKNITEATEPFVDEVKYSELPLKTWTADYVVVRIGGYWYLTDSFGNCYYESKKPYIICRNVFVTQPPKPWPSAAIFFEYCFIWSIVDLQRCVKFCCIAKWFSYMYIYDHYY